MFAMVPESATDVMAKAITLLLVLEAENISVPSVSIQDVAAHAKEPAGDNMSLNKDRFLACISRITKITT
jgi:hypothetical protein